MSWKITFWNAQKNADLNVRSLTVMSIPFYHFGGEISIKLVQIEFKK